MQHALVPGPWSPRRTPESPHCPPMNPSHIGFSPTSKRTLTPPPLPLALSPHPMPGSCTYELHDTHLYHSFLRFTDTPNQYTSHLTSYISHLTPRTPYPVPRTWHLEDRCSPSSLRTRKDLEAEYIRLDSRNHHSAFYGRSRGIAFSSRVHRVHRVHRARHVSHCPPCPPQARLSLASTIRTIRVRILFYKTFVQRITD